MSEIPRDYGHRRNESSAWERRELFREYQRRRVLAVQIGEVYLGLARAYVRAGGRNIPRAVGLLVRACEQFGLAGLMRRGQGAWRYARLLHRAQCRRAAR